MEKISLLINQKREVQAKLNGINRELQMEILNLPDSVLQAIALDIVKPIFPLSRGLREQIKMNYPK